MKRVIVSVSNDLITDQRVYKTCLTLEELGYEILLVGRKKKSPYKINRAYKTKRLKLLFHRGALFYAEFNIRLFFLLLFSKKDLLFANDVDTLLPNYLVSKLSRTKLIFDSHELFSEVPEIQNKKFVKWVWRGIENWIIPKLKYVSTVSGSIVKYYRTRYKIEATLVRNIPTDQNIQAKRFPFSTKNKKIIIYQGSVNIGRGLELMINAMNYLDEHIFVIAGDGDIMYEVEQLVLTQDLENKVKFLGKVPPKELKSYTLNADLGISLEEDLGLNYRFALPNKLFDYIQADIPVVVSDLPEMRKLVEDYGIGEICRKPFPVDLAHVIKKVLNNSYSEGLSQAKQELNWSKEKAKLVALINS